MTLPEIVLLETLQSALTFVRKDYNDAADKSKSFLALLMGDTKLEKYGLFEQAVQVICNKKDDPRRFNIDLMFNLDRKGAPTAHITLPAETTAQQNELGMGESSEDYIFEEATITTLASKRAIFNRRIQATYQIAITSDNSNEVILLYHFIRALLIALIPHLHMKGVQNVSFGGQDIRPYQDLSNQLYMRAVTVSLQYATEVPSIFPQELPIDVDTFGHPKEQ